MRRNALLILMLLVTLLAGITLAVSVYAFREQSSMTNRVLDAYVADLAESFSENFSGWRTRRRMRGGASAEHHPMMRRRFRLFSADPTIRSGGLLLLDANRRIVGGTAGAEGLLSLWKEELVSGEPSRVKDASGKLYHVVVRNLASGGYVFVVASKDGFEDSLSNMSRIWNFWLVSVMTTSGVVLAGMALLWRHLVIPIRKNVEAVRHLRWGKELPRVAASGLFELRALSEVIEKSASEAIEKEQLHLRYTADIVRAQEEERRRLARELHDGPLQSVVASIKRIQLAQAQDDASCPESGKERLDEAECISQGAAKEIRSYCDELSPSWLALGISSALEEMQARLALSYGVTVNLSVECRDEDLSKEGALAVVRILNEAASNSVRHGGATQIAVALARQGKDLIFEIADNGKGCPLTPPFDFEKLRLEGHRGLSNIHERVQSLAGRLEIESLPGNGCTLRIFFPRR